MTPSVQARLFWAARDDGAKLCGDHIQPFEDVLADEMEATARGSDQAFRLNHLFETVEDVLEGSRD